MTAAFHVPHSKADADPRRWVALIVLLLASFMNLIDVTIVNVALPSLERDLGAGPNEIEWVIAAYVLSFALGLLPFGRLGDVVGRTRMFLVGVAAFTAASAFCGLAPSIEWLIFARVLQGLAGAVMTPQVLAIAQVTFPPEEKGQAFSLFGLSASLAAVTGPLVGGVLIGADIGGLDWRPIFLVNIPFGVLAVVAGWYLIPRTPGHPDLKNDFVGIGLFGAATVALVFPIIEGRAYGWPAWAFGLIGLSLVLVALFVLWERRRAAAGAPQLLNYSLITNPNYLLGLLVTTLFASGVPAMFMVISLSLQQGYGFTPLQSGLINTPFSVGVMVVSLFIGRLGQRYLRTRLGLGAALLVLGISWVDSVFANLGETAEHLTFLPPLFIAGLGLGLGFSGLFQTVLSGVPPRDAGAGSGALQAFQQIGGAIGVAIVGEIFFSLLAAHLAAGLPPKAAYATAAAPAIIYQIVAFSLVVILVPFLRIRPPVAGGGRPVVPAEG
ncbi:MAG: DHA2 family efflux MFS transporter permease subunit [Devosia sp.]|nr:DHA2 family efflux MFS transporter permease subunit [Devosia sp.]